MSASHPAGKVFPSERRSNVENEERPRRMKTDDCTGYCMTVTMNVCTKIKINKKSGNKIATKPLKKELVEQI